MSKKLTKIHNKVGKVHNKINGKFESLDSQVKLLARSSKCSKLPHISRDPWTLVLCKVLEGVLPRFW